MSDRYAPERLADLIDRIERLRNDAVSLERRFAADVERTNDAHRSSAGNLLHYLAVRRHDIRDLQLELHELGLSSLGRMEAYTLASLDAVLVALRRLAGRDVEAESAAPPAVDFATGRRLLQDHARSLLGPPPPERSVRIMVTMPSEAADDYHVVRDLVAAGMDLARVNCAKDDAGRWARIVEHVRRAEREVGRSCRVHADLAGPNLRTSRVEKKFPLVVGDRLELGGPDLESRPVKKGKPARVGCSLPEVFRDVSVGDRLFYDDGALAAVVREVDENRLLAEVTHAHGGAVKMKSDKGVNLPDTELGLSALTDKDVADLDFVAEHVDVVGLSFVRSAGNVERLHEELDARGAAEIGVVLKIETRSAFEHLPRLLLTALRRPAVGIMVARGDMGVELGFARMAEVQEEILWLCEAAHVPSIWATQVLESLAKTGLPSRAEVTDAAMSSRAECVMLNKGDHIVETVRFLDNVLQRMHEHQAKKSALLRRLRVSDL